MDSLFKNEILEDLKNDRFWQAFKSLKFKLEEQEKQSIHDLFTEWCLTKTRKEAELLGRAYEYQDEYFSDLRLIDYKDELFAVKVYNEQLSDDTIAQVINEELESDDSDFFDSYEDEDILNNLSIRRWRFKLVDYDDETCCGLTSYPERLVEISNKYNDKNTLLHEMIHVYEFILKSYQLDDFVLLKLYDELLHKVKNIRELISLDKHSSFREHSLLFILKSLKLDLELGYKLGTIYAYGREDLYENNLI